MLGLGQPDARAECFKLLAQALAELDLEVGDGVRCRGGEKIGPWGGLIVQIDHDGVLKTESDRHIQSKKGNGNGAKLLKCHR